MSISCHIKVENLSHHFYQNGEQKNILADINLAIPKGQICGIIGPSGAGKSTLLRCLNGLEKPSHGRVVIENEEMSHASLQKQRILQKKIGIVFQSFNLLNNKTVYENVRLALLGSQIPAEQQKEKINQILHLVGISSHAKNYPSELSGGQKQRVAIARALVGECKILLCDEFTSALDPQTTLEILNLLKKLRHELGLTIVFVTHDMTVLKTFADYVFVLHHGKIVEENTIDSLVSHPKHIITQGLLSDLFHDQLPEFLERKIKNNPIQNKPNQDVVLKLVFDYQAATQPLMAMLTQKWGILPNIITGSLNHVASHTYGHLIISFSYDEETLEKVVTFLKENHVNVFPLGYMSWNS